VDDRVPVRHLRGGGTGRPGDAGDGGRGVGAELARRAALRARELYSGVVAELVFRELIAYAEFGHRFSRHALLPRLVADLLRTPGNVDSA
jgi:hypothetical protein